MNNPIHKKIFLAKASHKRITILSLGLLGILIGAFLGGCSKSPAELQKEYMSKGLDYLAKGKNNEAIIEFQNLLKLNPKSASGHFYLGEGYKDKGWITDALLQFRQSAELDPTYLPPPS